MSLVAFLKKQSGDRQKSSSSHASINFKTDKRTMRKQSKRNYGTGRAFLAGMTMLLLMVIGCDSIVDQNTGADFGIATSDLSGVL